MVVSSELWYRTVKNDLNKLKIKMPFYTDYEIYTKNHNNIDSIQNNSFINFVNTIKDYSYIIDNNYLYIIIPHKSNKYKFISL